MLLGLTDVFRVWPRTPQSTVADWSLFLNEFEGFMHSCIFIRRINLNLSFSQILSKCGCMPQSTNVTPQAIYYCYYQHLFSPFIFFHAVAVMLSFAVIASSAFVPTHLVSFVLPC